MVCWGFIDCFFLSVQLSPLMFLPHSINIPTLINFTLLNFITYINYFNFTRMCYHLMSLLLSFLSLNSFLKHYSIYVLQCKLCGLPGQLYTQFSSIPIPEMKFDYFTHSIIMSVVPWYHTIYRTTIVRPHLYTLYSVLQ